MDERRERRRDAWLETGRQIVDGVSGRRPGQRRSSLDLESVGRWVGDKVDWLLEEDDDWREPWQETAVRSGRRGKRPLEAISRRQPRLTVEQLGVEQNSVQQAAVEQIATEQIAIGQPPSEQSPSPTTSSTDGGSAEEWPEDDSFRVDRWQRSRSGQPDASPVQADRSPVRRALPRSSRRRA